MSSDNDSEILEKNMRLLTTIISQKNSEIFYPLIKDKKNTYDVAGLFLKDKSKLKQIAKTIKQGKIGWKDPLFDEERKHLEEHDNFLIHPVDVSKGVLTCNKCESDQVYSFQKQTRSADEPMTTFARCVKCNNQWTYSG